MNEAGQKPMQASGSPRLSSVDAYRGLVMFLMMAELFRQSASQIRKT